VIVVECAVWAAMIFGAPEGPKFQEIIENTDKLFVSAATLVELNTVVITKLGEAAAVDVVDLMESAGAEIVPVDSDQAGHAVGAFIRYGSGRHAAALSFGDIFSYALAKSRKVPLLFNNPGFAQTDVTPAVTA